MALKSENLEKAWCSDPVGVSRDVIARQKADILFKHILVFLCSIDCPLTKRLKFELVRFSNSPGTPGNLNPWQIVCWYLKHSRVSSVVQDFVLPY